MVVIKMRLKNKQRTYLGGRRFLSCSRKMNVKMVCGPNLTNAGVKPCRKENG